MHSNKSLKNSLILLLILELEFTADQLLQALLNIVRNAAQALNHQGIIILRSRVQRQCTIAHSRHKLVARLDIIDNGPGIPEEHQEDIFYPMISGRADGTGLGLSIAQNLANQHGGLIECASRPGRTVFSLLLPLEKLNGEKGTDMGDRRRSLHPLGAGKGIAAGQHECRYL